jgi:ATP-dependent RNA helicase RhlE
LAHTLFLQTQGHHRIRTRQRLIQAALHRDNATLGDRIYAFGGVLEQNRTPHDGAFAFDGTKWHALRRLPEACGAISCMALGDKLNADFGGVDVLVATPGRLLDLIDQGHVDLSQVEFFVLDEVDRMLDMGFLRDVKRIVAMLPVKRQSLFFSATLAPNIVDLAQSILRNPAHVSIAPETTTAEKIAQQVCFVDRDSKRPLLEQLLRGQDAAKEQKLTIVFSRTKHGANKLAKSLCVAGFQADAIHGNKSQAQREKALDRFKKGLTPVLVATDVAARGVDVKDVGLVVNFDLPNEPEAYVHRIGRTARAGAEGRAVSFCSEDELEYLRDIEKIIRMPIPRWDSHEWHVAALAERHLRGSQNRSATAGQQQRGQQRGNGGNRRR